jgi:hypothetical protein
MIHWKPESFQQGRESSLTSETDPARLDHNAALNVLALWKSAAGTALQKYIQGVKYIIPN